MGAVATTNARITISAVDRASRTLDVINNKMARVLAPVRRVNQSLVRFSNLFGLTRARNALTALSRGSVNAFRSVSRIVPILGSITGATTLAGIYRLSSAWADFGTKMRTTARSMGMPTSRLMAMQNAARLSGGSADAMTDAMGQISQLKWEMPHGFAPEAAAQFQALGISMQEVAKSSPDKLFARIADRIRRIKDPAAQTIAAMKIFGQAGEGLLPIFQQSSKEFRENIELARRYGVMNQKGADAAANLKKAQTELTLAVEGFGFSVAEAVEPALSPVIHQMADWIAVNRQWIAQNIAQYIRQVVRWLRDGGWDQIKSGVTEVMQSITGVVKSLGGWEKTARDVAIGMAVLWAAPALGGIASLASALLGVAGALDAIKVARLGLAGAAGYGANALLNDIDPQDKLGAWIDKNVPGASFVDNAASHLGLGRSYDEQAKVQNNISASGAQKTATARYIRDFYMRNGLTAEQATGLVADLDAESGFNPSIVGDKGSAYGLLQLHKDRQDNFRRVMGRNIRGSSLDDQLKFSMWEFGHTENSAWNAIRSARTAAAAGAITSYDYLRPGLTEGDKRAEMQSRGALAEQWASRLSAPPASVPSGGGSGLDPYQAMLLDLHVTTTGPHGVSAKATSKSGSLKVRSVTQQRAMDPESTAVGQ
ncbi:phage tail tip lysozyme [Acetobacter malorum]|uniref:phage tail tip lysozyme n=1 Tax=Acetobacter malorum TaxID=178901 RepID=UPI000777D000|nr:phage tail tip lysozyme [Acetobacter malorum]